MTPNQLRSLISMTVPSHNQIHTCSIKHGNHRPSKSRHEPVNIAVQTAFGVRRVVPQRNQPFDGLCCLYRCELLCQPYHHGPRGACTSKVRVQAYHSDCAVIKGIVQSRVTGCSATFCLTRCQKPCEVRPKLFPSRSQSGGGTIMVSRNGVHRTGFEQIGVNTKDVISDFLVSTIIIRIITE